MDSDASCVCVCVRACVRVLIESDAVYILEEEFSCESDSSGMCSQCGFFFPVCSVHDHLPCDMGRDHLFLLLKDQFWESVCL
jgi:hypothetical protein